MVYCRVLWASIVLYVETILWLNYFSGNLIVLSLCFNR